MKIKILEIQYKNSKKYLMPYGYKHVFKYIMLYVYSSVSIL